jgi:putative methyltransferase (TIGR04325 family)
VKRWQSEIWQRASRLAAEARTRLPVLGRGTQFVGDYATWADAERDAGGYDAPKILDKALHAILQVKSGNAAFERDTVLFDRIEYSFPLLAGLLLAATHDEQRLRVLDFGGALGSSYFQNRALLAHLSELRWGVVEQEHFVTAGRAHVADEALSFHAGIDACIEAIQPSFALLSGVLSYVERPFDVIDELQRAKLRFICLDRALVSVSGGTRLTVQRVSPEFYDASYPCWILDEGELLERLGRGYRRIYDFDAVDGGEVRLKGLRGAFKGYLFART